MSRKLQVESKNASNQSLHRACPSRGMSKSHTYIMTSPANSSKKQTQTPVSLKLKGQKRHYEFNYRNRSRQLKCQTTISESAIAIFGSGFSRDSFEGVHIQQRLSCSGIFCPNVHCPPYLSLLVCRCHIRIKFGKLQCKCSYGKAIYVDAHAS